MEELYPFIFKRKSYHLFRNNKTRQNYKDFLSITEEEIKDIYNKFKTLKPLCSDIKVDIKIVKAEETNCNRGEEYCILFYSEKKDNYLQNIGFLGEQLDLYLFSKEIGALWYGIGRTSEVKYNDLDFVEMMAICKVPGDSFRKDMFKSKRKETSEIWEGSNYLDMAGIVKYAPSSCNTQPWKVIEKGNILEIYRYKKEGKRGIMPINKIIYQNLIDIGIFLLFICVYLENKEINYNIKTYDDNEKCLDEYTHSFDITIL